jgi:hypothetical protein
MQSLKNLLETWPVYRLPESSRLVYRLDDNSVLPF